MCVQYIDPDTGQVLENVKDGLRNRVTGKIYPIVRGIARFCPEKSYADNFGDQWNIFQRTQLETEPDKFVTKERLWRGTEWDERDLKGRHLLELGCGAGRFTGYFLAAGADVWSADLSSAVEACMRNHGGNSNLHVLQADIYHLPFPESSFDYVFMYGVLQHTPNPPEALKCAIAMAKNGGRVAIDVYAKPQGPSRWTSKYKWRWMTTRLPPHILRRIVAWYIPRWLRIDDWMGEHYPTLQARLATVIPCWNYRNIYPFSDDKLTEWAVLDTYDALGAKYDYPLSRIELAALLEAIPNIEYSIKMGGNGWEVNLVKLLEANPSSV
jgi:SAM-dependent methyltransferase